MHCDWHIHTRHSVCGRPEASVALVCAQAREAGLTEFGMTDHLHCRLSVPALIEARKAYDAAPDRKGFHFGLEVSCVRRWDIEQNDLLGEKGSAYCFQPGGPADGELTLYLPDDVRAALRPVYIIGGTHWVLGAPMERGPVIRQFHRQYMFLATHPCVDIIAHPWWWHAGWQDEQGNYSGPPWLDDFGHVPQSMHEEFAAAVVEGGKAVEINVHAMLANAAYPERFRAEQYPAYLALLRDRGVQFSLGSDSHSPGYRCPMAVADRMLERLGVREDELWRPARA